MRKTEIARYSFTVQEGITAYDSQHWLMLQPLGSELSIFSGGGYIALRLSNDVSVEQAKDMARYLNSMVNAISYTSFHSDEERTTPLSRLMSGLRHRERKDLSSHSADSFPVLKVLADAPGPEGEISVDADEEIIFGSARGS